MVPCSPPSRTLRAACGGGLRPSLTAPTPDTHALSGRGEETAPISRTKKHHRLKPKQLLHSLTDATFLVTTPEAWVPALGDAQHGFPYLSGGGRLVVKDVALMAGAWLVLADSARAVLCHSQTPRRTRERSGPVASQVQS
jgi:hypothetical protein